MRIVTQAIDLRRINYLARVYQQGRPGDGSEAEVRLPPRTRHAYFATMEQDASGDADRNQTHGYIVVQCLEIGVEVTGQILLVQMINDALTPAQRTEVLAHLITEAMTWLREQEASVVRAEGLTTELHAALGAQGFHSDPALLTASL